MIDNVHGKQEILTKTLHENGASSAGFGDISFLGNELTRKFPVAISLGTKCEERIIDNLHIDEESFYNHLVLLNIPLEHLMKIVENFLAEWGLPTCSYADCSTYDEQ